MNSETTNRELTLGEHVFLRIFMYPVGTAIAAGVLYSLGCLLCLFLEVMAGNDGCIPSLLTSSIVTGVPAAWVGQNVLRALGIEEPEASY